MKDTDVQIKFDAPAVLRKWPSVNYERIGNSWPYIIAEGTLDECIRKFISKPASTHHLYEIHTAPLGELITAVLPLSKSLNSSDRGIFLGNHHPMRLRLDDSTCAPLIGGRHDDHGCRDQPRRKKVCLGYVE